MAGAKAFISASQDEDFGIVPVEAMMVGTPVIAHRSGGVLETVIEPSASVRQAQDKSSGQGATGLFFDDFSVESLNNAIKKFEKTKFDHSAISKHAQKFSKERFEEEIRDFVRKHAITEHTEKSTEAQRYR